MKLERTEPMRVGNADPRREHQRKVGRCGEGRVRALFTGAGNPVLSTPNGRALDEAFDETYEPTDDEVAEHAAWLGLTTADAALLVPPARASERGGTPQSPPRTELR